MADRKKTESCPQASDLAAVESGVPQGSVLGPVLFDIFTNYIDLLAVLIDILRKFADDTKLGKIVLTVQDGEALQNCLDMLVTGPTSGG